MQDSIDEVGAAPKARAKIDPIADQSAGIDMLAIFNSWYKSDEILSLAEVIVMHRPSHDVESIDPALQAKVKFMTIPLLEISSTDIRERVRSGKSIRYLVPEPVRTYIAEQGLYRD